MEFYCVVRDEWITIKLGRNRLRSLTNNKFENCIQLKHTIQNHNFFDIDSKINEPITNHNKIEMYLVKFDCKLIFDKEFSPHNQFELETNQTDFQLEKFLLLGIEYFIEGG